MTNDPAKASGADALVDRVTDWLMTQALGESTVDVILDGCCRCLVAAGIPLWRGHIAFNTLHPLFASISITWRRDQGTEQAEYAHETAGTSGGWLRSPLYYLTQSRIPYLRRRLVGADALLDFPILAELRDQGATDYLAYAVAFGDIPKDGPFRNGIVGSWTTDRPGGFTDRNIQALERAQKGLAVACKAQINSQIAENVLAAYLGKDAGHRVLNGQIKRSDGERIHAVIWYSDMRDSTPLAAKLTAEDFIQAVNSYFECTAGAVLDHGGEVLRFIGDAVLAIFPIKETGGSAQQACQKAWTAAQTAKQRMDRLNRQREDRDLQMLDFGLGLHLGDIMFGNIGVPERLEFSVIGPAANEVARLESLTKTLGRRVLVSGEFASRLDVAWESLGVHTLKGVGQALEVLTFRTGD